MCYCCWVVSSELQLRLTRPGNFCFITSPLSSLCFLGECNVQCLLIYYWFCIQSVLRNVKSLAPLFDRVLVQRIKPETKTASGIFLPESSVKEQNVAKVLAVGPGAIDRNGSKIPMSVAEGDHVLIPQVRLSSGCWVGSDHGYQDLVALSGTIDTMGYF